MKKLIVVVIVLVAALLAYNYYTTGEVTLVPSFAGSEEDQAVRKLEGQLRAAQTQFAQASRTAALSGLDMTADAETARLTLNRVQKELKALRTRLTSDSARQKADRLQQGIEEFRSTLK